MTDAEPPDIPAPPAVGHEPGRCCFVNASVRRKACGDHAAAGVPRNQKKEAREAVKALSLEQVTERCRRDGLVCAGCLDKLDPRTEAKLAREAAKLTQPPYPGHEEDCAHVGIADARQALTRFRRAQPSSSSGTAAIEAEDAKLDRDQLLALCRQHGLLCPQCMDLKHTRTRAVVEGFLSRPAVTARLRATLGLTPAEMKPKSKTALLDMALRCKAVSQNEYEASLPEFMRQVKAYLHSVLDPRLHIVIDQYVQMACAVAARGSRALNLRVGQEVVDHGPEAALELILDDTWVKQMVWPGSSAPDDVQQWWQQNGVVLNKLVLDSQLVKFLPTRDQMTAFFQRAYIGATKAHVHAHMAERLVALFQAEHATRAAPVPEAVIKAMLANDGLDELEAPWPQRVAAFRTSLGVDADLTFQGREVVDALEQQQQQDDSDVDEAEAGGSADTPNAGDAPADDPTADEGSYDGEDQDDDAAEAVQKSLLSRLWPLHCRLAQALWDKRAQQILERQEAQGASAGEQRKKKRRGERPPKLVPTISLLPVTRYARTYVPIDTRMMARLIGIHNKHVSKEGGGERPIPVPSEVQALAEMVQPPSKQALRQRRNQLRRLQKRMRPGAKKRAATCGLGLRAWPRGGELTSIRTDGVGVSLCFTIRGRKPARTLDSLTDAQHALKGCTRIALGGIDPGSKNMGTLQAAYLPDELQLTASPDDFWWREGISAPCACDSGSTCSCAQEYGAKQHVKTDGCVLSAGTYYARSLIKQQQRWQKARRRASPTYVHACSSLSEAGTWRTPDLQAFRAMCVRLNEHAEAFRAYDLEPVDAAKRRMLLFRRKRSLLDQSAQRMVQTTMDTAAKAGDAADAVVLGYGNASKKTPRGCAPVPHKELKMAVRRALDRIKAKAAQGRRIEQKGPRVVLLVSVDEFRTTMLCHVCHQKMTERQIKLPGSGRLCPDRNFRFCSQCGTTTEGARKRSRDGNAADNMLYKAYILIKGLELPAAFQRPSQAQQQH
jgi:hypothetical protein